VSRGCLEDIMMLATSDKDQTLVRGDPKASLQPSGGGALLGEPLERGHKALQQQTVRDPKYNNKNNNKKNYLYLAATRFMTSLSWRSASPERHQDWSESILQPSWVCQQVHLSAVIKLYSSRLLRTPNTTTTIKTSTTTTPRKTICTLQ
ncbi:unnamed protein product, partial [Polarella glacialis]